MPGREYTGRPEKARPILSGERAELCADGRQSPEGRTVTRGRPNPLSARARARARVLLSGRPLAAEDAAMRKPTEPSKNPARENLASMLKDLRSRKKQLQPLARDYWIIINSEIEPQKLHALGVITFRWNLCEQKLLALFGSILDCPIEETHVLALELSGPALIARIRLLASTRLKGDDQLIASILNALDVFDVCRRNRNQLTHFGLTPGRHKRPASRCQRYPTT